MSATLAGSARRAWSGLRWYLREVSGEARWDAYVDRCANAGEEPMSRRAWERHRAEERERNPHSRCC